MHGLCVKFWWDFLWITDAMTFLVLLKLYQSQGQGGAMQVLQVVYVQRALVCEGRLLGRDCQADGQGQMHA